MSTFHGLEMARQALFAQQSALYTTGHNISNVNTDGYSRQRVNFETSSPFPAASRNRPEIPGQMGTGVEIGAVQRLKDRFLDMQFRAENSKSGYWDSKSQALGRLESVLNEPSDSGLSHTMNQMWESLQDLSANPENSGARSVVAGRGESVADTLNYLSKTIKAQRKEQKNEMDATVTKTNSIVEQINNINKSIQAIEPHGLVANDLYDDRDRLIDELSEIINIKVTHDQSGAGAPSTADGVVTIELVDSKGSSFENPVTLIDGPGGDFNAIKALEGDEGITSIEVENHEDLSANAFMNSIGSLSALIETYGYEESGELIGTHPDMLKELDTLAAELAARFNEVHEAGRDVEGEPGGGFFVPSNENDPITAENIRVNQNIIDDPNKIAASVGAGDGDQNGENASDLAAVFDQTSNGEASSDHGFDKSTSINSFYSSLIGELGVNAEEANRMKGNTEILRSQVENQRMSVSAVSLDEEMSNMIQFQHAYNAAARSMTTIDEMLDKVINGMGIVGR